MHYYTLILNLEYNVVQPSPLNEKVLREKRRKLKETFDRVMKMYVSTLYCFKFNYSRQYIGLS